MSALLLITLLAGGCTPDTPVAPAGPASPAPGPSASPSPLPVPDVPHSLVFSATGTADKISAVYELDGTKTTVKSARLPWRKVVEIPADGRTHSYRLAITHGSGRVEVVSIFDGAVNARGEGAISGNGSGTVAVSGDLLG